MIKHNHKIGDKNTPVKMYLNCRKKRATFQMKDGCLLDSY